MARTMQQAQRAQLRAEASIDGALKRSRSATAINRALLSVVRALLPGVQKERQVHRLHVTARRAFTRHLRETKKGS